MSGAFKGFTTNYGFKLINYDWPRWHTFEWDNWKLIDVLIKQLGVLSIKGLWENNTLYIVGDRVVEGEDGSIWQCLVEHFSTPVFSFSSDRGTHPTYWKQISSVPNYRGAWVSAVAYGAGDIVTVNNYAYYLCVTPHTSSPAFLTDNAFWALVFDATQLSTDADAAHADAINAVNAATGALNSANNAQTYMLAAQTAKTDAETAKTQAETAKNTAVTAKTSAETAATNANNSATNAATSATNAATSATNAANSAAAAATFDPSAYLQKTGGTITGSGLTVTGSNGLWGTSGYTTPIKLSRKAGILWPKGAGANYSWLASVAADGASFSISRAGTDDNTGAIQNAFILDNSSLQVYNQTVWHTGNLTLASLSLVRKKEEFYPLDNLASIDFVVPPGASLCRITANILVSAAASVYLRISEDGTNFPAGANDYQRAVLDAQNNAGTSSVSMGAVTASNVWQLSGAMDSLIIPQSLQCLVSLTRSTTTDRYRYLSNSQGLDANNGMRTSTWSGYNLVASFTALSLTKLRLIASAGTWKPGSFVILEWF